MNFRLRDGKPIGVPTWAAIVWSMLIAALVGGGFWLSNWSRAEDERRYRTALVIRAALSAGTLRDCLGRKRVRGLSLNRKGGTWRELAGTDASRAENDARHLRVDVTGDKRHSIARFYTREAKPLRDTEMRDVRECLADGGS